MMMRRNMIDARSVLLGVFVLALTALPAPKDALAGVPPGGPNFVRGTLDMPIPFATSLAFGPDGRLYVASLFGDTDGSSEIWALTLDSATQEVLASERIATDLEDVMGLAFDPNAPSPVTVYASHRDENGTGGFDSKISTFTAPTWSRTDVITGLPTSRPFDNHLTNGLAFHPDGRLFIAQGSSTNAGVVQFGEWPETPLSSAILVADIGAQGFDGNVTYTPAGSPTDDNVDQTGGDVAVFAPGLRNPFDLVIHSNGLIYATDNGPMAQNVSTSCIESGSGASASDELNLVEEGNYYGHPNRNRGRTDPRQCTYRPPEDGSGADFTGPIKILDPHCSCNGILEYTDAAFGGAMQGHLVWAELLGNVATAELAGDGRSVVSQSTLASDFAQPLDVALGPDGAIYITELLGNAVSYLAPDSDRDGCADSREQGAAADVGGARDPAYFWDFFDVWTGEPPLRDRLVSIGDIGAVVARFGAFQNPPPSKSEALAQAITPPPPAPAYHAAADRSTPQPGGDLWDLGSPDGAITVVDIGAVVVQFGHSCIGA